MVGWSRKNTESARRRRQWNLWLNTLSHKERMDELSRVRENEAAIMKSIFKGLIFMMFLIGAAVLYSLILR